MAALPMTAKWCPGSAHRKCGSRVWIKPLSLWQGYAAAVYHALPQHSRVPVGETHDLRTQTVKGSLSASSQKTVQRAARRQFLQGLLLSGLRPEGRMAGTAEAGSPAP